MLDKKQILLIISGGIAAYKSLSLVRMIQENRGSVTAILTRGGSKFVTNLSLSALTGNEVYQTLFTTDNNEKMSHIELSRKSDLIVVAPASANLMEKIAYGRADDLASTVLVASNKPILIAPAMNTEMWNHPATQKNLKTIKDNGAKIVGPNAGDLACGEVGSGRMAEPIEILDMIKAILKEGPLKNVSALVTSGPTHEPIDPVRYITNRSSGKQGHSIANALSSLGADVTLISGPTALPDPSSMQKIIKVETTEEMLNACQLALPKDIAVFTAAVSDWKTSKFYDTKLKTNSNIPPQLKLVKNPDILSIISTHKKRPKLVIGFAAETENIIENAIKKLEIKKCDWIIANDVSTNKKVFGSNQNTIHILKSTTDIESWPKFDKQEIAKKLANIISLEIASFKNE